MVKICQLGHKFQKSNVDLSMVRQKVLEVDLIDASKIQRILKKRKSISLPKQIVNNEIPGERKNQKTLDFWERRIKTMIGKRLLVKLIALKNPIGLK